MFVRTAKFFCGQVNDRLSVQKNRQISRAHNAQPRKANGGRPDGVFDLDGSFRRRTEHNAGLRLAEQHRVPSHPRCGQIDFRARGFRMKHTLGQRHGQSSVGNVVRAAHKARLDKTQHRLLHCRFFLQKHVRGAAPHQPVPARQILGTIDVLPVRPVCRAKQIHHIAGLPERHSNDAGLDILHDAQHADRRGRVDGAFRIFVVEGHIAACHRRVEGPAGVAHASNRLRKGPVDLRLVRVAEIKTVRDSHRFAPGAYHVPGRLRHGDAPTLTRVEIHIPSVAVGLDGQSPVRALDAHHSGIARPRACQCVRPHHRIVLFEHPALRGDIRRAEQIEQHRAGVGRRRIGHVGEVQRDIVEPGRAARFPVIHGRPAPQYEMIGFHVRNQCAAPKNLYAGFVNDLSYTFRMQVPFAENGLDLTLPALLAHEQHPLLALRKHDLVGGHPRFALRHLVHMHNHAAPAFRAHFARGTGKPGGSHILNAHDRAAGDGFQRGLQQKLFGEWIAHLHAGTLRLAPFRNFLGGEGGAVNAVPSGRGPYDIHRIPHTLGNGRGGLSDFRHPHAHGVDKGIPLIGRIEIHLTGHGRHAEGIAVIPDSAHHPVEKIAHAGVVQRAEPERIERTDGSGAHREDVALDAAHAGSGPLVGLHRRGVIVRFDFERDRKTAPDIDESGIFLPGFREKRFALPGKCLQQSNGVLVGTVFAPHDGINAQLDEGRRATELVEDPSIFLVRQSMIPGHLYGDFRGRVRLIRPCFRHACVNG